MSQDDDAAGKIASCGSLLSGVIFASAWYLFWGTLLAARTECIVWGGKVPANCTRLPGVEEQGAPVGLVSGVYWVPGILSSFGVLALNLVSWEAVSEQGSFGENVGAVSRIWVVGSLIFMFSGVGGAIWCLVSDLNQEEIDGAPGWHAGGINTFIQTILICVAGFIFRLVRRSGEHAI